jgi:hypothetical protein
MSQLLRGTFPCSISIRRLTEVDDAKELMADAMEWSVVKWLWEKNRVRETADRANAALDRLDRKLSPCKVAEKLLQGLPETFRLPSSGLT